MPNSAPCDWRVWTPIRATAFFSSLLGDVEDYDQFLDELDAVWRRCFDALVPGGRLVVVVGDVNVSRRSYGRRLVFPLHASIQEHCRAIGFDNLAPIIWYKIANAQYEAGGGGFLGKPYEPNAVVKNDVEYILFQRKPGGYRAPDLATRLLHTGVGRSPPGGMPQTSPAACSHASRRCCTAREPILAGRSPFGGT